MATRRTKVAKKILTCGSGIYEDLSKEPVEVKRVAPTQLEKRKVIPNHKLPPDTQLFKKSEWIKAKRHTNDLNRFGDIIFSIQPINFIDFKKSYITIEVMFSYLDLSTMNLSYNGYGLILQLFNRITLRMGSNIQPIEINKDPYASVIPFVGLFLNTVNFDTQRYAKNGFTNYYTGPNDFYDFNSVDLTKKTKIQIPLEYLFSFFKSTNYYGYQVTTEIIFERNSIKQFGGVVNIDILNMEMECLSRQPTETFENMYKNRLFTNIEGRYIYRDNYIVPLENQQLYFKKMMSIDIQNINHYLIVYFINAPYTSSFTLDGNISLPRYINRIALNSGGNLIYENYFKGYQDPNPVPIVPPPIFAKDYSNVYKLYQEVYEEINGNTSFFNYTDYVNKSFLICYRLRDIVIDDNTSSFEIECSFDPLFNDMYQDTYMGVMFISQRTFDMLGVANTVSVKR
jgi:hypothetical protein